MLTAIETSSEILPGYVLVDRLGSGGYAEVWRASAPGGLFKAIKIVHGFYDEELAAQEMKAMERIKDVRHPFLLSLERFDVVDGRLVILTEMADKSLEQRACECRAEGLPGIPRDELLSYLEDAAEALDYLIEKKRLLHLDVKPENLLILGDHLKVADFGLVKELASRSQKSMVAGMTPTFAAPEMFDDHPSDCSDQYSLAIVYQLMLTATLPFTGRTAAQLAKQHTLSAPQLAALPPGDRDPIARALAKDPKRRFPSCRELVAALRGAGSGRFHSAPQSPLPASATLPKGAKGAESVETAQSSSEATRPRHAPPPVGVSQHLTRQLREEMKRPEPSLAPLREERVVDVSSPPLSAAATCQPPTLLIGVGGVGIRLLTRAYEVDKGLDQVAPGGLLAQLALDTDRQELKKCCALGGPHPLSIDDTLHLPLRLPKEYDGLRKQLDWLSRRWLYNIPRSLETRGYRPLGRLAVVDHLDKVLRAIDGKLTGLLERIDEGEGVQREIRVVLLAGMGGGTGSGTVIDIASAVRHVADQREIKVTIDGVLLGSPVLGAAASGLAMANMFALLAELRHTMQHGTCGALTASGETHPLERSGPPFDSISVVAHPGGADAALSHAQLDDVARHLAWSRRTPLADWLDACHKSPVEPTDDADEPLHFRTLAFSSLSHTLQARQQQAARGLHREVWNHWLTDQQGTSCHTSVPRRETPLEGGEGTSPLSREERLRSRFGELSSTRFAHQAIAELVQVWPANPDVEVEDPRVLSSVKRLAALLELRSSELPAEPAKEARFAPADLDILAGRAMHQLLARPQWNTYDPPQGLKVLDELLLQECSTNASADAPLVETTPLAGEGLEHAAATVLSCGFNRRTLAVLPEGSQYDALADSIAATRPTTLLLRTALPEAWIAAEGSGVSSQSLAVRLAHIHPDIAEAASRLHTRADIQWDNPLHMVEREAQPEVEPQSATVTQVR
jgi:serine/threonine protein kinase